MKFLENLVNCEGVIMKIIKKDQREIWETKTARGAEYPFGIKNIHCAVVEIFGRHPLSGWYRNTQVDEMIYCKSGVGEICFVGEEPKILKEDDAVFIKKNEWYYWGERTKGVFVPMCNPAWSSEQGENKIF